MTCKANSCYQSEMSGGYCSSHYNWFLEFKRKLDSEKNSSSGRVKNYEIKDIKTFETWFNNNCCWVVTHTEFSDSSPQYGVWVAVRERGNCFIFQFGSAWSSLSDFSWAGRQAENILSGDTPMIKFHPKSSFWGRKPKFSEIVSFPYVVSHSVSSESNSCLDNVFKSGDIIELECHVIKGPVKFISYGHIGVYLSYDRIAHFSKENNQAEICSWNSFLSGSRGSKLTRCHPIIPFKSPQMIERQACKAITNYFRRNNYDLHCGNCEHFANMLVYGIEHSQQIAQQLGFSKEIERDTLTAEYEMTCSILDSKAGCY
jgi:hypothetical protein